MAGSAKSLPPSGQETHPDGDDDDDHDRAKNAKHQAAAKTSNYERQQRYRDKQRQYVIRLESTVKRLRMDVDQLLIVRHRTQEAQREARSGVYPSSISTATTTAFVTTMCECMQSFESGAREQQTRFVESAMREDVQYGDLIGRQVVLDQWTQFALSFDGIPPVVKHYTFTVDFSEQGSTVGHAGAVLLLCLTDVSLANIFPNAYTNQYLRDKLLQRPVVPFPVTAYFQFDEQGKVCRYDPAIDFVSGLYAVLGNYRDVATTLQSAAVNSAGQFRGGVANYRHGTNSCSANTTAALEATCRSTSTVDKLSVSFILSNGEDM